VKAMKAINTEKDGYFVDIITDSDESALKSIPKNFYIIFSPLVISFCPRCQ